MKIACVVGARPNFMKIAPNSGGDEEISSMTKANLIDVREAYA